LKKPCSAGKIRSNLKIATLSGSVSFPKQKIEGDRSLMLPSRPSQTPWYLARLCIKAGKIEEAERIYDKLVVTQRLAQTIPLLKRPWPSATSTGSGALSD
jgi:hypothetical protein